MDRFGFLLLSEGKEEIKIAVCRELYMTPVIYHSRQKRLKAALGFRFF